MTTKKSFFILALFLCFASFFAVLPFRSPAVKCKFRGQLGNQLFEIATTLAYAHDHNLVPHLRSKPLKKSQRDCRNLYFVFHNVPFDRGRLNLTFNPLIKRIYQESSPRTYTPIPFRKNQELQGFFQSEKYFAHYREELLKIFKPPIEIKRQIQQEYGDLLNTKTVVSLHIRTFFPDNLDEKEIVPHWQYYLNALNTFPTSYCILVFSDYPEYAEKHFPKTEHEVRFIQGNSYLYDFWLSNHCHHFITSPGSTFSWWSAWLSPRADKQILCIGNSAGEPDFYPESWTVIPSVINGGLTFFEPLDF